MRREYLNKIEEFAMHACSEHGVSLYDVEEKETSKGLVILIYINKMGGVSVDDCTAVSRDVDNMIEAENLLEEAYMLEVSSPGIERELKFKKHYASAINEKIKVEFDVDDKREIIIGILEEVSPAVIKVKGDNGQQIIAFESIHKARTYFDFKKGSGK